MLNVNETLERTKQLPISPTVNETTVLDDLVNQYRQNTESSVEMMLEMARTLLEAKSSLSPRNFNSFCDQVKLDPGSSTYRKLHKIGERAARLEPHLDKLPFAWTTLYVLASLKDAEFKTVIESDVLTPTVTAKAIRDVVPSRKKKLVIPLKTTEEPLSKRLEGKSILLDLNTLERSDIDELIIALESLQADAKFKLVLSEALVQLRLQTK